MPDQWSLLVNFSDILRRTGQTNKRQNREDQPISPLVNTQLLGYWGDGQSVVTAQFFDPLCDP
jgi:hypothetical protein